LQENFTKYHCYIGSLRSELENRQRYYLLRCIQIASPPKKEGMMQGKEETVVRKNRKNL